MTIMKRARVRLHCAAGCLAIMAGTTAAMAQTAEGANDAAVGEIVVTALKRSETSLQTPATVNVVSAGSLANKNIASVGQLNAVVPGLTVAPAIAGLPGVSFRGVGSNSAVFNLEPSVAVYQDGVYFGHARDFVTPLYDIDHLEMIKGTQSTLLGKNTSLGAISVITKRPGAAFGYDVRASHSWRIDGNRIDGGVNLPINDKLQSRISFLASRDHGYVDNVILDRSESRRTDLSGRVALAWTPNDAVDVLLVYQHDYRRLRGQDVTVLTDPTNTIANRAAALGLPFRSTALDTSGAAAFGLGGTPAGPGPEDNQDTDRLNLVINWELGGHTLTSQTAYSNWSSNRVVDLDFVPANLFNLYDTEKSKSFSQEIRLASPSDQRFTYLLGLFYYYNKWDYFRDFHGSPSNTVGFPLTGSAQSFTHFPTNAYSAFTSMSLDLVGGLKLDGGLRYTHERKSGDFVRNTTGTLAGGFPTVPFTRYAAKVSNPLDYNVGLRFQANPDLMLYGTYSKGSKSGGFQDAPTTVAGAPFDGETAYTSELGAKWRLPVGSVTLALFNTRIRGFQTSYSALVGTPAVAQNIVGNSNVRTRGFETAISLSPAEGLQLSGNLLYSKATFTDNFPANGSVGRAGDPLTRNPKWTGQFDADYEKPLTDHLRGFVGTSLNYVDTTLYQFIVPQPAAPRGRARTLVDGRVGVGSIDKSWQVALIGTNLTNERAVEFASTISAGGGAYYGTRNRPRTVAVQLTLSH